MDATLLKTPRKKGDWQKFNVFKMQQGSAKQNSILALFVPFHKAFQKERDTSQRGYILFCIPLVPPSRGQTSVTTKATPEEEPPSFASAAPGESRRQPQQELQPSTPQGRHGWRKGQFTLCLTDSARQSSEVWLWRAKPPGSCWR